LFRKDEISVFEIEKDKMASSEMQMKKVNSGLNWKMTDYNLLYHKEVKLLY
jgi:hypothetical protein